jgi:hypothetical protein
MSRLNPFAPLFLGILQDSRFRLSAESKGGNADPFHFLPFFAYWKLKTDG